MQLENRTASAKVSRCASEVWQGWITTRCTTIWHTRRRWVRRGIGIGANAVPARDFGHERARSCAARRAARPVHRQPQGRTRRARARYRRHAHPAARRPGRRALQSPLRQLLLPAAVRVLRAGCAPVWGTRTFSLRSHGSRKRTRWAMKSLRLRRRMWPCRMSIATCVGAGAGLETESSPWLGHRLAGQTTSIRAIRHICRTKNA